MKTIKVRDKEFTLFIKNEDILAAIDEVCKKLNRDYAACTEPPVLLCTLHGAIPFTAEVMKRLDFETELACIQISSYEGTQSCGQINTVVGPTKNLEGKKVIVLEDIVDTGLTIIEMRKLLKEKGAADIKICTLMYKPGKFSEMIEAQGLEVEEHEPEYYGMSIDDNFILGFGLDYDQYGRNYKDIYILA